MIVAMKKLTLLCTRAGVDRALEQLRRTGAVHVMHQRVPEGESLEQARHSLTYVRRALDVLPEHPHAKPSGEPAARVVEHVWTLIREREETEEQLEQLEHEAQRIRPFGSFEPDAVRALEERGILIRLYRAHPRVRPEDVAGGAVAVELSRDKTEVCFALIGRDLPDLEDVRPVRLPERPLREVDAEIESLRERLGANEAAMAAHAGDRSVVAAVVDEVGDRVRYLEAKHGMGASERLASLTGYLPADRADELRSLAAANGWGVVLEEPAPEDHPPTLIRNPRWIRLIQPVFDFMGILPGYREVDISALFLVFFSIFFGMIVGDAGYGLLFLGLTIGFRRKLRALSPHFVPLMALMSLCTVAWGLLTGTLFGLEAIPAPLRAVQVDWLKSHDNLMLVCFLLGAVHLTIAHAWNAIRGINRLTALADAGWIMTTWFMFFVVRTMVLGAAWPAWALWLLIVGAALIVLFMTPVRQLKTEWFNHVMLPLNLISNFVDVVSYVRLFAVGLATYAVGNAFNGMALGGGVDGFFAGLMAAVVLFLGHALNIVMAAMSVMVHGIRLNTLEFSSHLGMQWSGVPYEPLSVRAKPASAESENQPKEGEVT
jgi:V/A-type H+/Na+-transporting ATPase subunit I